jgi:hypothetical protein
LPSAFALSGVQIKGARMPRTSFHTKFSFQPVIDELESRQLLTATVFQGCLPGCASEEVAVQLDAQATADASQSVSPGRTAQVDTALSSAEVSSAAGFGRPQDGEDPSQRGLGRDGNPGVEQRSDQANEVQDYVADQSFAVAENSDAETFVGLVATDFPNSSADPTYSLVDGNQAGLFEIDAATGVITVAEGAGLDFESQSSYSLTVQVDNRGFIDTAVVTIDVTDVNEAPTIADAEFTFALEENSPAGTPVGSVTGTDPDQGATLSYAITAGNEAGDFVIDPQTGTITVADGAVLDYESTASYELTVQVSDGLLAATSAVRIDLIDVPEGGTGLPSGENALRLATDASTTFAMEATTVALTDEWTTIQLTNTYVSPVIVGTVLQQSGDSPVVVRIRNVDGTSFEARLQSPSGNPVDGSDVFFTVVEEGSWQLPDGRNIEAHLVTSDGTNSKTYWGAAAMERLTLEQDYSSPVVLGQVMSSNDERWSTFWSSNGHNNDPAEPGNIYVGKHVGEDPDTTRLPETLGVIVVEAGSGQINGVNYSFNVGADSVVGVDDGATAYPVGITAPEVVVAVQAGMDGGDGGWAVVTDHSDSVSMAIDEDQVADAERSHTTEYVSYAAFESSFSYRAPLNTGTMEGELLDQAAVEDAAQAVISQFVSAGLSDALAAELSSYQFVVTDLSPLGADVLAVTEGNVIYLDDDAGGYGWFVDQTPQDSSEFTATSDGLYAPEESLAFETVDLMSVLASEFSEDLGADAFNDPADSLSRDLYLSERRDDYVIAVDQLLAE